MSDQAERLSDRTYAAVSQLRAEIDELRRPGSEAPEALADRIRAEMERQRGYVNASHGLDDVTINGRFDLLAVARIVLRRME